MNFEEKIHVGEPSADAVGDSEMLDSPSASGALAEAGSMADNDSIIAVKDGGGRHSIKHSGAKTILQANPGKNSI